MGNINLDIIGKVINTMANVISSVFTFAGHLGIWLIVLIFAVVIYRKIKNR
jgi:hypothetical protein